MKYDYVTNTLRLVQNLLITSRPVFSSVGQDITFHAKSLLKLMEYCKAEV